MNHNFNSTRRTFLKNSTAFLAMLSLSSRPNSLGKIAQQKRTNIVFIMADDLAYRDLGCYGQKLIKTPNIDRIADEGMRFTNCYSGSSVCAHHAALL